MLRCNCSSPGRSAARQPSATREAKPATMMDARQKLRRGAPSGVMDAQRGERWLRHGVRRNGRALAPRRGRTPPARPPERLFRTHNCRSAISRSREPQSTVNGRARKPAERWRHRWSRTGLARSRPWRSGLARSRCRRPRPRRSRRRGSRHPRSLPWRYARPSYGVPTKRLRELGKSRRRELRLRG